MRHRFQSPFRVEVCGDADCEMSIMEEASSSDDAWARSYRVEDATGLLITDIPFRNPNGLGFALLEKYEAKIIADTVAGLLTKHFAKLDVS